MIYLFISSLLLFRFAIIVTLKLQMKSAIKACDCHMTTACSNFKMVTYLDLCKCMCDYVFAAFLNKF